MQGRTDPPQSSADADVLRSFRRGGLVFLAGTAVWFLCTLSSGPGLPRDGSSLVVGRDFLNFWMYGRAAAGAEPWHWYNVEAYQRMLGGLLGAAYPGQNWSYPPSVMLLAAPFGQLPYLLALPCWTALGIGTVVLTLRRSNELAPTLLVSPAAIFCVISGQSSLLTTAALIGIFALIDRRPILAGVLIGCLTLKPQVGLLFPVMLLASRRWRALAAAVAVTLVLGGATAAAFGPEAWIAFIRQGLPAQNLVLADPDRIATPFFPTLFMNLRGIGLPYAGAMPVQLLALIGAVALTWWASSTRRNADPTRQMALLLAGSVAATPYLSVYDTLPLTYAALRLLQDGALDARGRVLAKLVFWLPLIQMALGSFHIPGPALIAPLFGLSLAVRLWRAETGRPAFRSHVRSLFDPTSRGWDRPRGAVTQPQN